MDTILSLYKENPFLFTMLSITLGFWIFTKLIKIIFPIIFLTCAISSAMYLTLDSEEQLAYNTKTKKIISKFDTKSITDEASALTKPFLQASKKIEEISKKLDIDKITKQLTDVINEQP